MELRGSAADLFDSVAIISGVKLDGDCDDSVATSILHFHGLYDDVIPLDGSGDFPSVYDGINFWVEQNRILESTGIVSSLNEGDVMLEQYLGGMDNFTRANCAFKATTGFERWHVFSPDFC